MYLLVLSSMGSQGDSDPWTVQCVQQCESRFNCSSPYNSWDANVGPLDWISQWDCSAECKYQCMRQHTKLRTDSGLPVVQYHGKWPFRRVLGMQELFSSVFSITNAIPNVVYFFKYRDAVPDSYYLKPLFLTYAVTTTITWIFSAAFHARDTRLTEALDYYFADLTWTFIAIWTTIRFFDIQSKRGIFLVFLLFGSVYIRLIYYLTFIKFDYAWNTLVGVVMATWQSGLWLRWAYLHWKKCSYAKLIVITQFMSWVAGSMEILDFAPFFELLDAHAIWHGMTSVLGFYLWEWVLQDALYNNDRIEKKKII
uniref:Post-GPI attachment to proteins factor 3 n=1 Tax=Arcella intermedia TaxID=1963864 RepID=A0A6B2LAN2_9EUKA